MRPLYIEPKKIRSITNYLKLDTNYKDILNYYQTISKIPTMVKPIQEIIDKVFI